METEKDYHQRRINDILTRIDYLNNCIQNNQSLIHLENGVGGSYLKRRNTRNRQNNDYRLSQWKSEVEGLERVLLLHQNKLKEL